MEEKNNATEKKESWEKPLLNKVGITSETQAGGDNAMDAGENQYS